MEVEHQCQGVVEFTGKNAPFSIKNGNPMNASMTQLWMKSVNRQLIKPTVREHITFFFKTWKFKTNIIWPQDHMPLYKLPKV